MGGGKHMSCPCVFLKKVPIASMYGICTYIYVYGKCRSIYHAWILRVSIGVGSATHLVNTSQLL